jgi:mannosyltransferase OCH1-like enzyme
VAAIAIKKKGLSMKRFLILLVSVVFVQAAESNMLPEHFGVDFHRAMSNNPGYSVALADTKWDWLFVKSLYNKHVIEQVAYKAESRIPKIIHHIWLGSPLPEKYKKFQESWKSNHPEWEYRLWTDAEVQALGLEKKAEYDAACNYGEKSDIARYEILYRFGGLYIDTDFECLQPFDVFHHCFDFYTSFVGDYSVTLQNGLIGSVPGHPILRACIDRVHRGPFDKDSFADIWLRSGPGLLMQAFFDYAGRSGFIDVALPSNYVYPWPHIYRESNAPEQIQRWIRPESFAVHHWHVSWNNGKTN